MSSALNLKIFYGKGISLSIKNKSFREAIEMVYLSREFSQYEPLKLTFVSTGKTLFMDKEYFNSYLVQNITQLELIELTECDDLYRNNEDITIEKQIIDAGSLWKSKKNQVFLISSDDWVETDLDLKLFKVVE